MIELKNFRLASACSGSTSEHYPKTRSCREAEDHRRFALRYSRQQPHSGVKLSISLQRIALCPTASSINVTIQRRLCTEEASYGSINAEIIWSVPLHHGIIVLRRLATAGLVACTAVADAVECHDLTHQGVRFSVCQVDLESDKVEVFYLDSKDKPLANLTNVAATTSLGRQFLRACPLATIALAGVRDSLK